MCCFYLELCVDLSKDVGNKKEKKKKRKMKRKKKKKREKRNIRALKEFSPAFSAAGRIEFSHTDRVRLNSARMGSFMKF